MAEDAGTEDEDKEEQEKEKIADDRPIDQSSSDSNSTSRNDPANMQLIGDVWVFTDPSSGVHYRHDGNGWVPYGTETETTALQKPQIEQEGDMEIVNGRWVIFIHADVVCAWGGGVGYSRPPGQLSQSQTVVIFSCYLLEYDYTSYTYTPFPRHSPSMGKK